ncbi:hypothetical protein KC332_g2529 [Hortaea werneckii]|uniref:Uncharacterized protein n=1 Tax=Hortaea werneckii EXF-2000 TaxID=1157616 RepID=A0A1Z5T3K7_HORWE|nr:hypothetical protein KC350_g9116 [Hortaea werneckii]OTA30626.1 hypothetical protein BTJ68_09086 [Hortaea werneckii EXF-2000]KAI6847178.1 hypothetical protein KC358_g2458 [Hortaea werneckii]KAI6899335.1 hypothetical protein KC348_g17173 [Hortaea werneckii]KAI6937964.1 hypothetical protein KC341_g5216 [Hortaea werneckii]
MGGEGEEDKQPSRFERVAEGTGNWMQRHRVCTTIFAASLLALCIARDETARREDDKQDLPFVGSSIFNVLFVLVATGLLYTTRRTPPFLAAQRIQVIALTGFLTYALGLWAWESEAVRRGWMENGEEATKPWSWAAWCEAFSQSGMEAPLLDFNIINLAMMLVGKAWGLEPKGEDDDEQLAEEGRGNEKAALAAGEEVGDFREAETGMEDEKRGFEGFPAWEDSWPPTGELNL